MNKVMSQEKFTKTLFALLDETFETHHGMYLNKNTSFFQTLDTISPVQASTPIGGKSATIAAQVAHVTFYLEVLEQYMQAQDPGEVDWSEIWRTVGVVTPDEWKGIQSQLKAAQERVLASMKQIDSWDNEAAIGGALAIVVHTAYHLGGIRQAMCTLR
jgi:hypothetical protein